VPTIIVLCRLFLVDELDDLRNQFGRHDHNGLPLGQKSRFVLGNLFVVGLIFVMLGKLADSVLVPSGGVRLDSFLLISFSSVAVCETLVSLWESGRGS
jgi:hypothetical protein